MRYIDSGSRESEQTFGFWLQEVLGDDISEVRWQSGFFNEEALGYFVPALEGLSQTNGVVRVLIGSNAPGGTPRDDVIRLVELIGLPRRNANLGVVRYGNAFYHPKTYHFRRTDGSQCAYVGSSNLTAQGAALHTEAGLTLDSRNGDPIEVLEAIASAVDVWFDEHREGVNYISAAGDVDALVTNGVLTLAAPPPAPPGPPDQPTGGSGEGPGEESPAGKLGPILNPLIEVPALPVVTWPPPATHPAAPPPPAAINPANVPVFHQEVESGHLAPRDFEEFWVEAGSMSTGGSHNILELPRYANHFFGFDFDDYQREEHVVIDRPVLTAGENRWEDRQLAWHGGPRMNKMERIPCPPNTKADSTTRTLLSIFGDMKQVMRYGLRPGAALKQSDGAKHR
jgi:hypothetical protein